MISSLHQQWQFNIEAYRIPLFSILLFLFSLLQYASAYASISPTSLLRLEHRYSRLEGSRRNNNGSMTAEHFQTLLNHDKIRHRQMAATRKGNPASFPVAGKADPTTAGLYFTELRLGTPPSSYYVQIDTGSDLLWINCEPCTTCPLSTSLGVSLTLYDPDRSTSSSVISCEDEFCNSALSGECSHGQECWYALGYGDGSTSKGYLVQDTIRLKLLEENDFANVSLGFGCATQQSSSSQQQGQALDGIMGLGQSGLSVIKQLVSQGKAPGIFAHCLEGEGAGGGILVIGDVQASGIVYTPIVPNKPHYNVNLINISVSKEPSRLDLQSYVTGNKGTIIDSGTTLTYLVEEIYQPLIEVILLAGPAGLQSVVSDGITCIVFSGSLDDTFPTVTFMFDGAATMKIKPHDYFIRADIKKDDFWCVGFQSQSQSNLDLTILGDLVLKDRLVVYDLEEQQIGWVNYDCSSNVSVLTTGGQSKLVFGSAIVNSRAEGKTNSLWTMVWLISALFFCL